MLKLSASECMVCAMIYFELQMDFEHRPTWIFNSFKNKNMKSVPSESIHFSTP